MRTLKVRFHCDDVDESLIEEIEIKIPKYTDLKYLSRFIKYELKEEIRESGVTRKCAEAFLDK